MDFKIRVAENIGAETVNTFGNIGSVLCVEDGMLYDLEGFQWTNDGNYFHNVEEINEYFSDDDYLKAKFELVTEMEEPTK